MDITITHNFSGNDFGDIDTDLPLDPFIQHILSTGPSSLLPPPSLIPPTTTTSSKSKKSAKSKKTAKKPKLEKDKG